jgi:hypothetical protein
LSPSSARPTIATAAATRGLSCSSTSPAARPNGQGLSSSPPPPCPRRRALLAVPFWPSPCPFGRGLAPATVPPPPCPRRPCGRAATHQPLQQPNRLPLARGGPARFAREEHSTLLGTGRVCRMRGGSGLGLGLALALGIGGGRLGGPRLGVSVPPKASAQGLAPPPPRLWALLPQPSSRHLTYLVLSGLLYGSTHLQAPQVSVHTVRCGAAACRAPRDAPSSGLLSVGACAISLCPASPLPGAAPTIDLVLDAPCARGGRRHRTYRVIPIRQ